MHKIMNFNFFSKIYSQWILNRAQKYQEFNGENLFESDVSLRNCREKGKRLEWTHACRHVSACVSYCQV
jgi:hypothetical protein